MTDRPRLDFRKIRIVFQRELRDQLRDRRTLFMVMALPVLLYPALGIGMLQMAVVFSEKPRTVVMLGSASLPSPQLVDGTAFAPRWFSDPDDAQRLTVETTGQPDTSPESARRLSDAKAIHKLFDQRSQLVGNDDPDSPPPEKAQELQRLNKLINVRLRDAGIDVLVVIPDGFADSLQEINRLIASRSRTAEDPSEYPRPVILVSGDEKSLIASRRVERVFNSWEKELLRLRLEAAGLPRSLPSPVDAAVVKIVGSTQESALVWGKLYPVILVLMTVTGAFYPAVDLAAGEKERGTMETLLISPAKRIELVLAKFLTVMVFSTATAVLNLISLGLTATYMVQLVGSVNSGADVGLSPPPTSGVIWLLIMILPLAAFFSAISLALATFARSTREGQYYLSPLMIVVMLLVALAASPGVELQPFHSVLPVLGPILLLRELLVNPTAAETLAYLPAVLGASFVYAGLALWWAVSQFHSESVLFREAERFDLRLWVKRLWTRKPPVPGPGGAITCLAIAMFGQVLLMQPLAGWLSSLPEPDRAKAAIWALVAQQILLFLLPAWMLTTALLSNISQTFRLRRVTPSRIALAVGLAVTLHPLVQELMRHLQWFFPQGLPEGSQDFLKTMLGPTQPAWLLLFAVALTPAICEEFLFRGFVLSAFDRPGQSHVAVLFSAVAFGAVHMIPHQVFYATLLGLVLGLLVIRTGSIWPGLAFHAVFNGIAVLRERWDVPATLPAWGDWLISNDAETGLSYDWPLLLIAALAATVLLATLWRWPSPRSVR
ncbi:MAG TPA: CPBP family intramembrane metalloprotease domain-containing protein [Planctomycetaceae bacterium]|nr:CPBP family intramembrane metalloprotease domain-containing protein [Planctomycetaceae bacterium]